MAEGPSGRGTPYQNDQIDQQIGSLLERWLTASIPDHCSFCRVEETDEEFCSEECEENFQTVMDARLAIGRRDLEQRGYD